MTAKNPEQAECSVPIQSIPATLRLGRCDGCKHNWYSAPGGQAGKPDPHSRCLDLQADIPMVLGDKGVWLASAKPAHCAERRGENVRQP